MWDKEEKGEDGRKREGGDDWEDAGANPFRFMYSQK
jgi:hypothetical protein